MSKLNEIKKALGKILFNFEEMVVGEITYVYEKLEVGEPIFVYDEQGEKQPAEDATFESDGKVITIKDGLIESIEELEAEPEEEEEAPAEVELEEEEVVVEDPVEDPIVALEARVADLELRLEVTINTVNELVGILNETVVAVDEFSKEPVARKIKSKFKADESVVKGGSKASKYFSK